MRGRGAVLGLVVGAASTLVLPGVATAADAVAAAPVSVDAPVGIVAVAFGVVGMVTGFVRHRRAASVRAAAVAAERPAEVQPATTGV
ncbi:hypothetical protein [Saccharothrix sp. Mg75]|uniref:hypothetical protein n=1 Tax=Saccharothrix sp. Mg75 TaxID=3445357 RepID=UPI003EECF2AA